MKLQGTQTLPAHMFNTAQLHCLSGFLALKTAGMDGKTDTRHTLHNKDQLKCYSHFTDWVQGLRTRQGHTS